MNSEKRVAEFSEEDDAENSDANDAEYSAKVKSLNQDFLKWIQDYMAQSPYYIFTPVCKEYIQYMDSLDKEFGKKVVSKRGRRKKKVESPVVRINDKQVNNVNEASSSQPSTSSTTSVSTSSQEISSTPANSQNSVTFGLNTSAPSTSNNSLFSFGVDSKRTKLDPAPKPPVIGADFFSMSKPNSEIVPEAKQNDEVTATGEDEPYQPPKPESVVIEENDCVYSKRCKLFYKKDAAFVDRGIGVLYVKKQKEDKYQLLIRADTTLGNILLNIQLHQSLPLSVSKKGVLLTCIPNPPISSKANDQSTVCFFIKVRNEDDAKDLLKNLNEYSGK